MIPRWLEILLGLFFGIITLLCIIGSVLICIPLNKNNLLWEPILGIVMFSLSIWALIKCFNLVTGRKSKKGLLSPLALRIFSVFLLLIPIGGIFTGYFNTKPILAWIQTVAYIGIFFQLQTFAANRESENKSLDKASED